MPVVPFIPMIVSAVGGAIASHRAQSAAAKRSKEEQTALTGAQGASAALAGQGAQQFETGTGLIAEGQSTLAKPTNYFSTLLSGNRALQSQAVAAPRGAITDTYAGAERGLERSGVRGAARDVAKGELGRQAAGQISSLITGVQPAAASALTSIGQTQIGQGTALTGQGAAATGMGANVSTNLLGQGFQNRVYARGEGQQAGSSMGSILASLLSGYLKSRGGGGGGAALPGAVTTPITLPDSGG